MKKHSDAFYKKAYREYTLNVRAKLGTPMSFTNFRSAWDLASEEGIKNKQRYLYYSTMYDTKYETALAELRALRDLGKDDVKLKTLQKMDTQAFAGIYKKEIKQMFDNELSRTGSKKAARELISTYWFGSK